MNPHQQTPDELFTGDPALDLMAKYAPRRGASIEAMIRKYILEDLPKPARVLEYGAGRGEFIFRFLGMEGVEMLASEIDNSYIDILKKRVKVFRSMDEIEGQLDGIFLIDVLEHIEDDGAAVREMYSKLRKGGRLFIYVPARQELYSKFDKDVGHFRRYSLKQLMHTVEGAGFEVKKVRYHEILSYFAAGVTKILKRDDQFNPGAVKFYNNVVLPATSFIERIIVPPIGKSLYLFAVKE